MLGKCLCVLNMLSSVNKDFIIIIILISVMEQPGVCRYCLNDNDRTHIIGIVEKCSFPKQI